MKKKLIGADWEWVLLTKNPHCYLRMRVQAKRLYHKGKGKDYVALRSSTNQTSRLIYRAKVTSSIPLYIFYNHGFGEGSHFFYETAKNTPYCTPSDWGCSVVNAENIRGIHRRKKAINKLENLINYMKPMHFLIADDGGCMVTSTLGVSYEIGSVDRPIITDGPIHNEIRRLIENFHDHVYMSKYIEKYMLAGVAIFHLSRISS